MFSNIRKAWREYWIAVDAITEMQIEAERLLWEEYTGRRTPMTDWAGEREDVLNRFLVELRKATGDGSKKRQAGEKPPWYRDKSHEAAIFSHIMKWKKGEQHDKDSGAHPLVHAAWRCLAIACSESGNVPDELRGL